MRKILSSLILAITLISAVCYAETYNLFDMYQKPGNEGKNIPQMDYNPLYGKYPLVGVGKNIKYYLDTSSCVAYQENDKFVIACIVYSANEGTPLKVQSLTHKFLVKKTVDDFSAILESVNDKSELAQEEVEADNGFLRFLLLQVATYSEYPAAKVQSLSKEAEGQLKKDAAARKAEDDRQRAEARRQAASSSQPSYNQSYGSYIGNANSGKFHVSSCPSVGKMNPANRVYISSREEAINRGYVPCRRCRP